MTAIRCMSLAVPLKPAIHRNPRGASAPPENMVTQGVAGPLDRGPPPRLATATKNLATMG